MSDSAERITVVVADDHPVYREGLIRALNNSGKIEVVAELGDGRSALTAIRDMRPTVALVDYKMPDLDGRAVLKAVVREDLPTHIILLSAFDDSSLVYETLADGAAGYLSKESDRSEIVAAVIKCAAGAGYLPAKLAGSLVSEVKHRAGGEVPLLTPREAEVIRLISGGLTVSQIGARLHLAPSTVKTHVQNLYAKLGVSDRAAAVAEAMRRGLLA